MSSGKITVRMDEDIKAQLEKIFNNLGMNLTTGINVWAKATIRHGGFPFELKTDESEPYKHKSITPQKRAAAQEFLTSMKDLRKEGFTPEDEAAINEFQSGKFKPSFEERLS